MRKKYKAKYVSIFHTFSLTSACEEEEEEKEDGGRRNAGVTFINLLLWSIRA